MHRRIGHLERRLIVIRDGLHVAAESFPGLRCLGLTVFPLVVGRLLVGLHHPLEERHLCRLGSFQTLVPRMEDLRRGNQEILLARRMLVGFSLFLVSC